MANSFVISGNHPYGNVILSDLVGAPNPESGLYKIFNDVDNFGNKFANAELAVAATTSVAGDYMPGSVALAGVSETVEGLGDGGLLIGKATSPYSEPLTVSGAAEGYVLSITSFTPTPTLGWIPSPSSNGIWNRISGVSATLLNGHNYVATNVARTGFNLPGTASVGETYRVSAQTEAGWIIELGSENQRIRYGNQITTAITGSIASTEIGDVVQIACIDATTPGAEIFLVLSSIGNLLVA